MVLLALKIKSVILPAKMGLFWNGGKKSHLKQASCGKSHRQIQQKRKGMLFYGEKGGSWEGVVLNESSLEKSENSGKWRFFIGSVAGIFISCDIFSVHLFFVGAYNWFFLVDSSVEGLFLAILPVIDIKWYYVRAPPSGFSFYFSDVFL